jgi:hypothetical protein
LVLRNLANWLFILKTRYFEMNLSDIVSKAAPLIGGFLAGGPIGAGAAVLKLVASEFGVDPEEEKVAAAIAADPDAMVKLKELELNNKENLQRMTLENETTRLVETQKTMREEIKSEDSFVRRARPFQLWAIGGSVVLEILVGAFVILFDKSAMGDYVALCQAMVMPQSVLCAVCGVYMKQRSNDKAIASGVAPGPGLLAGLLGKT